MRNILLFMLATSVLISCSTKEERQQKLIAKSFGLMEQGQTEKAVELAADAVELDIQNPIAWNAKGVALYKNGNIYEAVYAYEKAISLKPDYTRAYYNRSNAFYLAGEFYRALDDLEPVLKSYADSAFVHMAKGLSEVGLKQYELAKRSFKTAAALDSANAEIFTNLASVFYFQDSLSKADEIVQIAINLNDKEANAWNLLSLIQTDQNELNKALESINEAVAIDKYPAIFS